MIFVIDTAVKGGMTVFSMKILACETFYPTCHSEDAALQATLTCMKINKALFHHESDFLIYLFFIKEEKKNSSVMKYMRFANNALACRRRDVPLALKPAPTYSAWALPASLLSKCLRVCEN